MDHFPLHFQFANCSVTGAAELPPAYSSGWRRSQLEAWSLPAKGREFVRLKPHKLMMVIKWSYDMYIYINIHKLRYSGLMGYILQYILWIYINIHKHRIPENGNSKSEFSLKKTLKQHAKRYIHSECHGFVRPNIQTLKVNPRDHSSTYVEAMAHL